MLEHTRPRLAANADVLEIVHEAARLEDAVYPVDPDVEPIAMLMPYLAPLRSTARLLCMEAVCRAQSGETAVAAGALLDCAALPASLDEGVTLLDALVRIAADEIWAGGVEQTLGLCQLAPTDLSALRRVVAREEEELSLERAFLGERTSFLENVRWLSSADRLALDDWGHGEHIRLHLMVPGRKEQDILFFFDIVTDAARIAAMPVPQRFAAAKAHSARIARACDPASAGKFLLSGMLLPATARTIYEELRGHAALRVTTVALAAEEWRLAHGDWPESLAALVPGLLDALPEDPFTGGALCYQHRADGVVVYSVGLDGQDNGGITRTEAMEAAGDYVEEGWDIPFRLLNPELRGARSMTFRDEVTGTGMDPEELAEAGFPRERLLELGFAEEDLAKLR
jgi:hypothetical protein